ncbi:hypothetical protein SDC9_135681 [bioreactor metagenome]|uniref:Uncharacterized protein n=1 Tax=bioreactor metagenome TaxID=1076179 RepID=A0A645DH37_9ZZZZ
MAQAVQRIVHARPCEQRQRLRLPGCGTPGAVGDAVVHGRQIGQIEHVAHQHAALGCERALDVVVLGKRKVDGNRLAAQAHFQLHVVAGAQQAELLQIVVGEQIGPRQRGFIPARPFHKTIGKRRGLARHGGGLDAHEGVVSPHMRGGCFPGHEALHGIPQEVDLLLINALHLRQGVGRVGKQRRFCDQGNG